MTAKPGMAQDALQLYSYGNSERQRVPNTKCHIMATFDNTYSIHVSRTWMCRAVRRQRKWRQLGLWSDGDRWIYDHTRWAGMSSGKPMTAWGLQGGRSTRKWHFDRQKYELKVVFIVGSDKTLPANECYDDNIVHCIVLLRSLASRSLSFDVAQLFCTAVNT